MKKRIAALTMVRNDDFFLEKWVAYYGAQFGKENLYVFFDGNDQLIPSFCDGTNAQKIEKIGTDVVSNDKGRVAFLSAKAAELFGNGYDLVIGTDADEYIVPDPSVAASLADFLNAQEVRGSLSALGIDMGQKLPEEKELRLDAPFLAQRRYGVIGTRYTKASILAEPLKWGSGFHRVKGENFHIARNLYLFHFGYCDLSRIEARYKDADRKALGWEKHIRKRSKTIRKVCSQKVRDWTFMTKAARNIQTWVRPPYAWNKPAMFNLTLVVKVSEKFSEKL